MGTEGRSPSLSLDSVLIKDNVLVMFRLRFNVLVLDKGLVLLSSSVMGPRKELFKVLC